MWIVLCESHDAAARWAFEGLSAQGLTPLELVTGDELRGARIEHRIGRGGGSASVELDDGRRLTTDEVQGGLNRLQSYLPAPLYEFVAEDRQYVQQESFAAAVGWLSTLSGNWLNPPTPQGLSGGWRADSEWRFLAGRAGLPVEHHRETASGAEVAAPGEPQDTGGGSAVAFALPDEVVLGGVLPAALAAGCRELAHAAEVPLLGIRFSNRAGKWSFEGATPTPDLRSGGAPLLDALARVLQRRAA